jgi:lysine 2,3-aminomutase
MLMKYGYLTTIDRLPNLTEEERFQLREVCKHFAFRINEYYASLIDWNDPDDPLRRIVVPHIDELEDWGRLNASNENKYTVMQGFQHKYSPTVVLLLTDMCGGFCRFCFRKRLFMNLEREIANDIRGGLDYIHAHHEVTNVLITGGDPLILPTRMLENAVRLISEIDHVRIIRIGSKMPAYNPYRIIDDPSLLEMIQKYSARKRFYIMCQFNHPYELTKDARAGIDLLQKAGAETYNQTPVIRGVNDNPNTLSTLFRELTFIGIAPYYVFQCRPTLGNKPYAVPVEEAYMIFQQAKRGCAGLAKSARYVMSHVSGKIEVIGLTKDEIILRYHQPASADDHGHVKIFQRNPEAYWLDDYVDAEAHIPVEEDYDD